MADATNRTCTVYGLSASDDPGVIRYVGQTRAPLAVRVKRHRDRARSGQTAPVWQWMREAESRGATVEIVGLEVDAEWNAAEIAWIARYGLANLLNAQTGGDNGSPDEGARERIGRSGRGRKMKPHLIEEKRAGMLRAWSDLDERARRMAAMRGIPKTAEAIEKRTASRSGFAHTESAKRRMSESQSARFEDEAVRDEAAQRARRAWANPSLLAKIEGENGSNAKLTEPAVRDMRLRYAAGGITLAALAEQHGVAMTTVHHIIKRRTWKNVL